MSLEAAVGRIDQILAFQQALANPRALAAASPSSASPSTSSAFASQLASAQAAEPSGSAALGTGIMPSALPGSLDV